MDADYIIDGLTKKAADSGNIIEMGWVALKAVAIPKEATETQLREMRKAFFAGAQHLFASIVSVLDPDAEPTPADIHRIEMIHVELEAYVDELKREIKGIYDAV